jgi:hypothetical protein
MEKFCVHISFFTLVRDIEHGWGVQQSWTGLVRATGIRPKPKLETCLYFALHQSFVIVAVQFPYRNLVVICKRCVLNDGKDPDGVEILILHGAYGRVTCHRPTSDQKMEIMLARAKYKH